MFGLVRVLHDDMPAAGMQRGQRAAAIIAGARQDDRDRPPGTFRRQRTDQEINRQAGVVAVQRARQVQHAEPDRHEITGRADVDFVGVDRHPLSRFADAHGGVGGEQFGQLAGVMRIEMLDQQKRHAGIGRHGIEQLRHCIQPARRSPDRHHRHCCA